MDEASDRGVEGVRESKLLLRCLTLRFPFPVTPEDEASERGVPVKLDE